MEGVGWGSCKRDAKTEQKKTVSTTHEPSSLHRRALYSVLSAM